MSLFKKKKKTKEIQKFINEESLPQDIKELEEMYDYYEDIDENIANIILKKIHLQYKEQTPYNIYNWARDKYIRVFKDYEEYGALRFDMFLEDLSHCYVKNKKEAKDSSLWVTFYADYDYKSSNAFLYHEGENLSNDMKEENAIVEYFENHLEEFIDAVNELSKKENQKILHTTPFIFYDLFEYIYHSDERFSLKIFKKTNSYLSDMRKYYDSSKDPFGFKENMFNRLQEDASIYKKFYKKEKLLKALNDKRYYKKRIEYLIYSNPSYINENLDIDMYINTLLNIDPTLMIETDKKTKLCGFIGECCMYTDKRELIDRCLDLIHQLRDNSLDYDERNDSRYSNIDRAFELIYEDFDK